MRLSPKLREISITIIQLRKLLKSAMEFKNNKKVKLYHYQLTVANAAMSTLVIRLLEQQSKTDASNPIGSPVCSCIDVPDNPTLDFKSPDRNGTE